MTRETAMAVKEMPKEITVHAAMKDKDDFSVLDATNLTIPVTVANNSSHTISYGGRVTIKNFRPFTPLQSVPIYFGEISPGDEETQYANWELEPDDNGNPTYPSAWSYTLHADGGGWNGSDAPGDFVRLKIYVYDSDWSPS